MSDDDESRLRIVDEPGAAAGGAEGPAPPAPPPRRSASGNRLDASIVKLRERQLLMKREERGEGDDDVENGESPPPAPGVAVSPSVAPLNPEVILTEVNSESEAAARNSFNANLQHIKV